MMKRIFSSLIAAIMVIILVGGAAPTMAADDEITIRIHYHRKDGNYTGWELWAWDYDGHGDVLGTAPDGTATDCAPFGYELEGDEAIFTIRVKSDCNHLGYIVRFGEWEDKDMEHDQQIDITGILSGSMDFYVESGVPTQPSGDISTMPSRQELVERGTLVLGADVVEGVRIVNTYYEPFNRNADPEVTVTLSSALPYETELTTYKIIGPDGEVPIVDMRLAGRNSYLTLGESLDPDDWHYVEFEGTRYVLIAPAGQEDPGMSSGPEETDPPMTDPDIDSPAFRLPNAMLLMMLGGLAAVAAIIFTA